MEDEVLKSLLRQANTAGHEGYRLVRVEINNDISASQDPLDAYTLFYDYGPQSASESW